MKNFIKLLSLITILMTTSVVVSVCLALQYQWRLALIIFVTTWAISAVIYALYTLRYFN